jgi:hypothetical protein
MPHHQIEGLGRILDTRHGARAPLRSRSRRLGVQQLADQVDDLQVVELPPADGPPDPTSSGCLFVSGIAYTGIGLCPVCSGNAEGQKRVDPCLLEKPDITVFYRTGVDRK